MMLFLCDTNCRSELNKLLISRQESDRYFWLWNITIHSPLSLWWNVNIRLLRMKVLKINMKINITQTVCIRTLFQEIYNYNILNVWMSVFIYEIVCALSANKYKQFWQPNHYNACWKMLKFSHSIVGKFVISDSLDLFHHACTSLFCAEKW